MRVGKKHNSITLEADAHHLMTDVWTSAGVIAGVGLVAWSGLAGSTRSSPLVAANIDIGRLPADAPFRRRPDGPPRCRPTNWNSSNCSPAIAKRLEAHALRTRQAGSRVLSPASYWCPVTGPCREGHDWAGRIEPTSGKRSNTPRRHDHLEPIGDPIETEGPDARGELEGLGRCFGLQAGDGCAMPVFSGRASTRFGWLADFPHHPDSGSLLGLQRLTGLLR